MSRAIEKVTISSLEEGRVVLGNAQIAATLNVGTSWSKIRLGARYCLTDSGDNLINGPKLCLGVMSNPAAGLTNGPLSGAGTGHYIGTWHDGTGTPTWTRSAGPPVRYSGQIYTRKKVGNTLTNISFLNARQHSADSSIRKAMFVQIERGSPWTVRMCLPGTWTGNDHSFNQLKSALENPSFSDTDFNTIFGESSYTLATATVAVDEGTNGPLNAIVAAWDRTAALARFSEVLFSFWP